VITGKEPYKWKDNRLLPRTHIKAKITGGVVAQRRRCGSVEEAWWLFRRRDGSVEEAWWFSEGGVVAQW
jgi:hypothetical protein